MPTADIIPSQYAELAAWAELLALKFPEYGERVGFTHPETDAVVRDCQAITYGVVIAREFRIAMQAATAFRDSLLHGPPGTPASRLPEVAPITPPDPMPAPGAIARLRAAIQRLKAHPGYSRAMGEGLGIVAPPPPPGPDQPVCEAVSGDNFEIRVYYKKARRTGVIVEGQRGSETEWVLLGVDHYSPYTDTRPPLVPGQPEVRRYRLRYLDRDTPTGEYSNVLVITAHP